MDKGTPDRKRIKRIKSARKAQKSAISKRTSNGQGRHVHSGGKTLQDKIRNQNKVTKASRGGERTGSCQAQLLAEAAGTPVPIDQGQAEATAKLTGNAFTGHFSFQPIFDVLMKEEPDFLD